MTTQTKEIAIKDLPDCFYKEQLERLVKDSNATVWVVAKYGYINDWACYIGWPTWEALKPEYQTNDFHYYTTMVHAPEDVVRFGDKFDEYEAKILFPEITLKYRR
jgi:hypothetical protein